MLWERTENQGWAGFGCCLGGWFVDELKHGTISPLPNQLTPTLLGQESMPARDGVLSWRLNAKSIQLQHPPLHLTFQGTHICSLRCQTFSTCYFALVPYVNSAGVSGGWARRSGSTKVAKMGMRVRHRPSDYHPLWRCWLHVMPITTECK